LLEAFPTNTDPNKNALHEKRMKTSFQHFYCTETCNEFKMTFKQYIVDFGENPPLRFLHPACDSLKIDWCLQA